MPARQIDSYVGRATITLEGTEPFAVLCNYVVEQEYVEVGRGRCAPALRLL